MSANRSEASPAAAPVSRWRRGFAWGIGLAVALLLAGVVSFYASSSPDGLEWVAAQTGFEEAATEHAAISYSPLADYQLAGLSDPQLSGGLAGVIGTVVVLAVGLGLMWALRKRPARQS